MKNHLNLPVKALGLAFTILACSWLCSPRQAEANAPRQADLTKVTATVSSDHVQIAEPFTLEMKITAPAGTKVVLPAVGERLGQFDVIDHQDLNDVPSAAATDQRTWTRRMTLESIVTGDLAVPALEIQVADAETSQTIKSNAIPVNVISVLEDRADPTKFRDIHSVLDVEVAQPTSNALAWWISGGVGLLMFAAAAIAFVTRRKSWLTPAQWALGELDELKNSAAFQSADSETVCLELSFVLRQYLELQFEISAPLQTTQELLKVIQSRKLLDAEAQTQFRQIFESADQAKFAGLQLTREELSTAVEEATQLIERTCQTIAGNSVANSGSMEQEREANAIPAANPTATQGERN